MLKLPKNDLPDMKFAKRLKVITFLLVLFTGGLWAQAPAAKGVGLGLYGQAGNAYEDGGIYGRYWVTPGKSALQFAVSLDINFESIGIYAGYEMFHKVFDTKESFKMPLFWGPYGGFGMWDNGVALRAGVTGGISFIPGSAPIDITFQLDPVMELYFVEGDGNNDEDFKLMARLGMRYFF